jgi:hypothetical protein
MGWLKYVVAGVGGAIVGGPVGAAAALGAVKVASSVKKTVDDDAAKQEKIQREHMQSLEKAKKDQERRDKSQEEERLREEEILRHVQQAAKEYHAAEKEKNILDFEQTAQLLIAQFAIGIAASHIDGHMSKDEMNELAQFINGNHSEKLPAGVIQKVQTYQSSPPSLQEAMEEINRLANPDYEYFRKLIELIVNADGGTPTEEEINFLKDYDNCVSTARERV